ncbi:acetyl-CoA carboxylase biotin carboxyl carrier protein, partial [bacterium]|nr:acetyl-CoA carboxylase biotin carboxyl carrier protein [bacterium]
MDLNQVKKLVRLVETSQIDELEIQDEGIRIRVTKSRGGHVLAPAMAQSAVHAPVAAVSAPQPAVDAAFSPSAPAPSDKLVEIRSPMVGTFYRA